MRAAMLMRSPRMSSPSTMMSPTCTPMRRRIIFSSEIAWLRSPSPVWIATAHSTAATTDGNSSSSPSPVVLTMRPQDLAISGSINSDRWARSVESVPVSSPPMSSGVADDVGCNDRRKSALDPYWHAGSLPARWRNPSETASLGLCRQLAHLGFQTAADEYPHRCR